MMTPVIMNGLGCGLLGQSSPVPVQFQSVGKVLSLLLVADDDEDGNKLLVMFIFLFLFKYQHEVVAKTGLHLHPVHSLLQVNVCS